jgi:hypothetical protein
MRPPTVPNAPSGFDSGTLSASCKCPQILRRLDVQIRRGHSRLVRSPREHLDTSAAGVPVCAGQQSCVRSAAADGNAPRWAVKPAHRKLLVYANVFVERELRPRVVEA